jgi:hypothetical protein
MRPCFLRTNTHILGFVHSVLVHVEEVMAIRQTNELLAVTPPDTKKLLQLKLSLEEKFKTLKQPDGGTVDEDHLMNEKGQLKTTMDVIITAKVKA